LTNLKKKYKITSETKSKYPNIGSQPTMLAINFENEKNIEYNKIFGVPIYNSKIYQQQFNILLNNPDLKDLCATYNSIMFMNNLQVRFNIKKSRIVKALTIIYNST
jgi:hypothetical protein